MSTPTRVDLNKMRLLEGIGPAVVWAAVVASFLWFGGYKVLEADVIELQHDMERFEVEVANQSETALIAITEATARDHNIELKLARMEVTLDNIARVVRAHPHQNGSAQDGVIE